MSKTKTPSRVTIVGAHSTEAIAHTPHGPMYTANPEYLHYVELGRQADALEDLVRGFATLSLTPATAVEKIDAFTATLAPQFGHLGAYLQPLRAALLSGDPILGQRITQLRHCAAERRSHHSFAAAPVPKAPTKDTVTLATQRKARD